MYALPIFQENSCLYRSTILEDPHHDKVGCIQRQFHYIVYVFVKGISYDTDNNSMALYIDQNAGTSRSLRQISLVYI